jgi:glutamine amidotransferase
MKIALIDTQHSNLRSVERALLAAADALDEHRRQKVQILRTDDPDVIRRADKVVVPGQGGFRDCINGLHEKGVAELVVEQINKGTPYLGICLGLQALFESSEEAPGVSGLSVFKGHCKRLSPAEGIKIPHMGWNQLKLRNGGHPALDAAGGEGTWVYFVHSFHGVPEDNAAVCATVQHGPHEVTAAVARDNVIATQFHPEKSQQVGIRLLEAFLHL